MLEMKGLAALSGAEELLDARLQAPRDRQRHAHRRLNAARLDGGHGLARDARRAGQLTLRETQALPTSGDRRWGNWFEHEANVFAPGLQPACEDDRGGRSSWIDGQLRLAAQVAVDGNLALAVHEAPERLAHELGPPIGESQCRVKRFVVTRKLSSHSLERGARYEQRGRQLLLGGDSARYDAHQRHQRLARVVKAALRLRRKPIFGPGFTGCHGVDQELAERAFGLLTDATHGVEIAHALGAQRRDGDQHVVGSDEAQRHVALAGDALSQLRELGENGEFPSVETLVAGDFQVEAIALDAVARGIAERLAFRLGPREAAALDEQRANALVERNEMDDVIDEVLDLRGGERPRAPIADRVRLAQANVEQLLHEIGQ